MRIAYLVDVFPALSETFILNQITGLKDLGHEVIIITGLKQQNSKYHSDVDQYDLLKDTYCHNAKPQSKIQRFLKALGIFFKSPNDLRIKLLRSLDISKYGKDALALSYFYKIIAFREIGHFDILVCHFGQNGILASILKDLGAFECKYVTVFHGSDMSSFIRKNGQDVYKKLLGSGDMFLPISENWKNKLIELGSESRKIRVHRMGIDASRFEFTQRQYDSNRPIQLLTIARLVEKKGVRYGIQAVAQVLEKYPHLEYNIIGDGFLRDNLNSLITKLNLNDKIKLIGSKDQNEIIQYIKQSDILIAPSVTSGEGDQEGIPVVLMEALAMGLVVISTYHSGIPEIIQDGISGYLVDEMDVDNMAKKIVHLIENPQDWPQMGTSGRKFVEENHNIKQLNSQLEVILKNVIK